MNVEDAVKTAAFVTFFVAFAFVLIVGVGLNSVSREIAKADATLDQIIQQNRK